MNKQIYAELRALKRQLLLVNSNLKENQKAEKIFEKDARRIEKKLEIDRAKTYLDQKKYLLAERERIESKIASIVVRNNTVNNAVNNASSGIVH